MNPILNLFCKDLRRLSLGLVGLILLEILWTWLSCTNLGFSGSKFIQFLIGTIPVVKFLLVFFLVVVVVQHETLADPDKYWLSRPLPKLGVLAEKIIFTVVVIGGISVLAELVRLLLNDGTGRFWFCLGQWLPNSVFLLILVLLAAQTKSILPLIAWTVGIIVVFYALLIGIFSVFADSDIFVTGLDIPTLKLGLHEKAVYLIEILIALAAISIALLLWFKLRKRWLSWAVLICLLMPILLIETDLTTGLPQNEINLSIPDNKLIEGFSSFRGSEESVVLAAKFEVEQNGETEAGSHNLWVKRVVAHYPDGQPFGESYFFIESAPLRLTGNLATIEQYPPINITSIDRSTLNGLKEPLDLRFHIEVVSTVDRKTGELRLEAKDTISHNGDRLGIRRYFTEKDYLTVELAACLPEYGLEPRPLGAQGVWLPGNRYQFFLSNRDQSIWLTGLPRRTHHFVGRFKSMRVNFQLPADVAVNDLVLHIFEQYPVNTASSFLEVEDIAVELK